MKIRDLERKIIDVLDRDIDFDDSYFKEEYQAYKERLPDTKEGEWIAYAHCDCLIKLIHELFQEYLNDL